MSSKDRAKSEFVNPANENKTAVRRAKATTIKIFAICGWTKNIETASTIAPTRNPLTTPPAQKPAKITQFGVGDTSISSILRWNFAPKNELTTFVNEFVITAIMTNPGIKKAIYEIPSISLICEPINEPKIRKYKICVIAEGSKV